MVRIGQTNIKGLFKYEITPKIDILFRPGILKFHPLAYYGSHNKNKSIVLLEKAELFKYTKYTIYSMPEAKSYH